MPITGWNATDVPAELLLDSAVAYVGATAIGASRGGFTFEPGHEYRDVEVDGVTQPIKGLKRIVGYKPVVTGELLVMKGAVLSQIIPGVGTSGTGPVTYTPPDVRTFVAGGGYLTKFRLVQEKGDGKFFVVQFACAMVRKYGPIKSQDQNESTIPIEVEACLDMSVGGTQLTDCPYQIIDDVVDLPAFLAT